MRLFRSFSTVAKSFGEIPGPKALPFVGTLHQYLPFIGRYEPERLHRNALKNYEKYGSIFKEEVFPGVEILWLVDPEDIATMYRTEGQYPERRSHLALQRYRLSKPEIYETGGLLPTNGPAWGRIRKTFQKGLSGPQDVLKFFQGSEALIQEWMDTRLADISQETNDFLPELSRLYLELLGLNLLDVRFQSFYSSELHKNSKSSKLLDSAMDTNEAILSTDHEIHLWRGYESSTYKKLKKSQEYMESVAIELLTSKSESLQKNNDSLLGRYFSLPDISFKELTGLACDFLLAGMDTTSYSTSFLLYNLAKNPRVQEEVYSEACRLNPDSSTPISAEMCKDASYTKCVIKENFRLRPISIGVGRVLTTDVVFSGYKVPKGTLVVTLNQVACRLERYFTEANTFKPERWIKNHPDYENVNGFLVVPFGFGQRSCIARRFAEQNMIILLLKLLRKYKLRWMGGELDSKSLLVNKPDAPILIKFEKR